MQFFPKLRHFDKWYVSFMVLGCILLVPLSVSALNFTSFDGSGNPVNVGEAIEKNPGVFLSLMEKEIRLGRLDSILAIAPKVLEVQPDNIDALSYAALSYALLQKDQKARDILDRAKKITGNQKLVLLCAEAILERQKKEFKISLELSRKAIQIKPSHPYPLNVMGRIYLDMGEYDKASESFLKAISIEPQFIPAFINLGSTAFFLEDYDAAEKAFKEALKLDPDNFDAHRGISVLYENSDKMSLAVNHFQRSFAPGVTDLKSLYKLADLQLKAAQYESAYATAKKIIEYGDSSAYPIIVDALLHLGKKKEAISYCEQNENREIGLSYACGYVEMVTGDYKSALKSMESVLIANPNHFGAFSAKIVLDGLLNGKHKASYDKDIWPTELYRFLAYIEGNLAAESGDYHSALGKLKNAEKMILGFSVQGIKETQLKKGLLKREVSHLNLGALYFNRDLTREAMGQFAKAIEINKKSIFGNFWSAQVFLKNGDKTAALSAFKSSLAEAPDFFVALYAIGELSLLTGTDKGQAAEYYSRALTVKNSPGILIKLGMLHEMEGRFEEAEGEYKKLVEQYPELFLGYNQLAWLYTKQGKQLKKAMELAVKADKMQPGNASILDTIGWIYYQEGDYKKASEFVNKALAINPGNPTILYHLGKIQISLGKKEAARKNLQAAAGSNIEFEEIKQVQETLRQL